MTEIPSWQKEVAHFDNEVKRLEKLATQMADRPEDTDLEQEYKRLYNKMTNQLKLLANNPHIPKKAQAAFQNALSDMNLGGSDPLLLANAFHAQQTIKKILPKE